MNDVYILIISYQAKSIIYTSNFNANKVYGYSRFSKFDQDCGHIIKT